MKKTRPLGAICMDQPSGRPTSESAGRLLFSELSKELWRDCDVGVVFERLIDDDDEELSELSTSSVLYAELSSTEFCL